MPDSQCFGYKAQQIPERDDIGNYNLPRFVLSNPFRTFTHLKIKYKGGNQCQPLNTADN